MEVEPCVAERVEAEDCEGVFGRGQVAAGDEAEEG